MTNAGSRVNASSIAFSEPAETLNTMVKLFRVRSPNPIACQLETRDGQHLALLFQGQFI